MKLLLVVQRLEDGDNDSAWVTQCADEYTIDEHNGTPEFIQQALDADPPNTRLLWVTIPEGSLAKVFEVPTVAGKV